MTDAQLHQRASELFLRYRHMPAEAREQAMAEEICDDSRLRAEVIELLAHDEPTAETSTNIGRHERAQSDNDDGGGASGNGAATTVALGDPPEFIGPYRVIGRLGHGGSGHVFLAEQSEPIRRRVAIKVVPQAAVNSELAARFEVERRALERTEHPNIARVLDAGRMPGGIPYLVIDYVEGAILTEYCRQRRLPLTDRIRLVLDVAEAVQHAHQRGVIHRDLKPANILVTEVDGQPTPRVLDFGIAKPVTGDFAAESPPTSGLPVGTPSYMAPEQTAAQPVDTRADVYALGAVLFELVAGRPPLDVRNDAVDAMQRIREDIPPPASRMRARSPALAQESVKWSVLTDLDCILARALEKSPDRRYPTVSALADDLRRLLRQEPIEARRPTWRYRAARFAQRNRALVVAASFIILSVAVGIVGLTVGLLEANRHRIEAINQGEAQREINRFLTEDILASASPNEAGGDITARELLDRASRRIDARFPERPLIAAAVHQAIAGAYAELGALDSADRHIERALWLLRGAAGLNAPDTVRSEIAAASMLVRRQKNVEAETALRSAIDRARVLLGPEDPALYTALNDLGVVFITIGRANEAVTVLQEALIGRTRLLGPGHRDVLVTTGNLAYAHDELGETEKSLRMLHDALRIAESLPDTPSLTLIGLHNNIGATYQDLDRDEEAVPFLRRAAKLADRALGPDHPATLTIQGNLAGLESEFGDPERAAEMYDEVAKRRVAQLGPDAPDTLVAQYGYWDAIRKARRFDEAAEGFLALMDDMIRALGENHWLTAQAQSSLARCLVDSGRLDEALPHAREAEERLRAIFGPDHSRTQTAAGIVEEIRMTRRD